jgi:hypothetical protein
MYDEYKEDTEAEYLDALARVASDGYVSRWSFETLQQHVNYVASISADMRHRGYRASWTMREKRLVGIYREERANLLRSLKQKPPKDSE